MGRVYLSGFLSHNTRVLKRGQKLTNTLKTEEVRMYSSSLLRNGLWRKCLVTEFFLRVRLGQQTCLMALALLRWGVSGPATVDTHYTAGPCGGCWEETYTAREACAQGPAWTPIALLLCPGTWSWSSRVPHHGFGTNTIHHCSVLLLWFFVIVLLCTPHLVAFK